MCLYTARCRASRGPQINGQLCGTAAASVALCDGLELEYVFALFVLLVALLAQEVLPADQVLAGVAVYVAHDVAPCRHAASLPAPLHDIDDLLHQVRGAGPPAVVVAHEIVRRRQMRLTVCAAVDGHLRILILRACRVGHGAFDVHRVADRHAAECARLFTYRCSPYDVCDGRYGVGVARVSNKLLPGTLAEGLSLPGSQCYLSQQLLGVGMIGF